MGRSRVGAEQRRDASTSHELCEDDEDSNSTDRGVQQLVTQQLSCAPRESSDHERSNERGGQNGDGLGARLVRESERAEEEQHRGEPRTLEQRHERERDHHEDRIERVLRHDRSRVERRRHSHGEQRDDERPALRDDSAREQVRGDGRERHEQRVDQLDRAVDGRDRAKESVRRTDQDRIDDAVASRRRPHGRRTTRLPRTLFASSE